MSTIINFLFYHTPVFYLIQSLWRDEAFSYFMAQPSVIEIIKNTANDFNPPLYYLALHFWSFFVGKSDELLRIFSLIPHLATVYVAYYFAKKMFSEKFGFFVAAFTFFNPMLLYYALEIRMYSFYAFFALATLYFYYIKKWRTYSIMAVAGLYTHTFFPLIIASLALYVRLTEKRSGKTIRKILLPFLFFIPWVPVVVGQFLHSGNSWIFPVDIQLIQSVLGNLFTGFDGTPGKLWPYTALLSFSILLFTYIAYRKRRRDTLFLAIPAFLPLALILGYSLIKRPIFVNRYVIFISVLEVFLISAGIFRVQRRNIRWACMIGWLLFCLIVNVVSPLYKKKTDFKTTFGEINKMARDSDYVYAKTPIGFLESAYYFKHTDRVYVYNPENIVIPNYIGMSVVFPTSSRTTFPPPPSRTFVVSDDASFEVVLSQ